MKSLLILIVLFVNVLFSANLDESKTVAEYIHAKYFGISLGKNLVYMSSIGKVDTGFLDYKAKDILHSLCYKEFKTNKAINICTEYSIKSFKKNK